MITILQGDWIEQLKTLESESVQCVVTSPPYYRQRDYKMEGQVGMEKSPSDYIEKLVLGLREAWRVMRKDATLWINLGDSFAQSGGNHGGRKDNQRGVGAAQCHLNGNGDKSNRKPSTGFKPKDLMMIPARVAIALQEDGWYLRQDIIWEKPNPMPESVTDRCTRAHEFIFMLTKQSKYYYNHEAIRNLPSPELLKQIEDGYNGQGIKDYVGASVQDASVTKSRIINGYRTRIDKQRGHGRRHAGFNDKWDALSPAEQAVCGSNKRSVWTVAPANFKEAHFATFPPDLIRPCILAGTKHGDTVLDPFSGAFTTCVVALDLGRKAIGIELNPAYIEIGKRRCENITPDLAL